MPTRAQAVPKFDSKPGLVSKFAPAPGTVPTCDTAGIIGFAAHDGNNRGLGCFGPSGTLDQHRGKGIGQALLLSTLVELASDGHTDATSAWIGPRNFYERTCGAGQGNQYLVLERPI